MPVAEQTAIACTLDSGTMAARLDRIKAFTHASLLSHEQREGKVRIVYRRDAADELRAIVELERRCCAFLRFDVHEAGRSVVLTISAPPGAEDAAVWLLAQFLPARDRREPKQACGCGSERTCG